MDRSDAASLHANNHTADDNMKRLRHPFDDLANGIYRGIDNPMTGGNVLDNFVKSAYLSNDLNDRATDQCKGAKNNKWLSKYEELRKYKDTHGNCLVRQNHPTLGTWVRNQRQFYRRFAEGKKSSITRERMKLLNSIGFVWNGSNGCNTSWMNKFEELQKYKEAHGDCLVRTDHPTLGNWVSSQRHLFRHKAEGKKSLITQKRFDLLNSIGFVWNGRNANSTSVSWMDKFEELRRYKQAHGDCLVRRDHPTLGHWAQDQRQHCRLFKEGKKSFIIKECVDLLNSIGFV